MVVADTVEVALVVAADTAEVAVEVLIYLFLMPITIFNNVTNFSFVFLKSGHGGGGGGYGGGGMGGGGGGYGGSSGGGGGNNSFIFNV